MGTISLEHSDRLYWLGRYTERVFTTLRTLQELIDRMLESSNCYREYLSCLGLSDTYSDNKEFIQSFLYDSSNPDSIAYSLERAYDNGIVLREEISTDALSFLQLAKDTLKNSESSANTRFSLLPLEDLLFGFWGCIEDHVYDEERKNIIFIGKSVERLDLYIRMKYSYTEAYKEFVRLCKWLRNVPDNTPFRYNTRYLGSLVEIIGEEKEYRDNADIALASLEHLFEKSEVRV